MLSPMRDHDRPFATPEAPDVPGGSPRRLEDPGQGYPWQDEFSRPGGDEFDGGRGGVSPEYPGDERAAPDGAPASDVTAPPDDPGVAAVDDHVAGAPNDLGNPPLEGLDPGVERERLNPPNQGFRPGG
jgi:hypothetical protein